MTAGTETIIVGRRMIRQLEAFGLSVAYPPIGVVASDIETAVKRLSGDKDGRAPLGARWYGRI